MKRILNIVQGLMVGVSFLIGSQASASIDNSVIVFGKIGNIAKAHVELKTLTGPIKVPKKYFNQKSRYFRSGRNVKVRVPLSELVNIHEGRQPASKKNGK